MLTVDYQRLGLRAGERLLDLGCGFGRHAYEGARRGADVVACDRAEAELGEVQGIFAAMAADGDLPTGVMTTSVTGDAVSLPFPDASFDRIIASEVLEHIPDDRAAIAELARVLARGGHLAVTVPAWLSETVCWWLSDAYHAPLAEGGHVRIYTEPELRRKLSEAGLEPGGAHHAHGLHSPYWWLKCLVGPTNDTNPLVGAYHRLLAWDIVSQPAATRWAERLLNPLIGKSLVLYARRPAAADTAPVERSRPVREEVLRAAS